MNADCDDFEDSEPKAEWVIAADRIVANRLQDWKARIDAITDEYTVFA